MNVKKIYPIQGSYVRSGAHADKNIDKINEEFGLPSDMLVLKHAPGTDWNRYLLLKFDLSEIDGAYVRLLLKTGASVAEAVNYSAHPAEFEGDPRTLTYNTFPAFGEKLDEAMLSGFMGCNITKYVADAKKAGKKEIALVICASAYCDMEIRIKPDQLYLEVLDSEPEPFVKSLSGDEKKDAEIWAWAEKLYDEWHARYVELENAPELEAELIESPEEQYTKTVYYSSSSTNYESTKKPAKTRNLDDLKDIDEYAPQKEYKTDLYGGLMDESRRREATGFFRVEKIDGRFWVIDPLGYPFVVRALSQVEPNYQGSEYQMQKTLEKFGTLENWGKQTARRLRDDLHFFASASPSPYVANLDEPIVAQRSIGFAYAYGRTIGTANSKGGSSTFSENNTMNVFDPVFVEFADRQAQAAEKLRDNPNILGFTTDNELPMQERMLLSYLSLDPDKEVNYYSYACAWTWLKNMTGKEIPAESDIKPEYYDLFRGFVWDRYYNVVTSAMRKYDPNHMLLGTRFLTGVRNAKWVLKFAGLYLDCITINWYGTWQPQADSVYLIAKSANCPFMITEFYAKAGDSGLGNTAGAGQYVETQKDRGMFYQNYTLRLLEAKNCVGWHWFQYLDNDPRNAVMPDGRIRDVSSTNSNKGIVSNEHEEYTECTKYMAEINRNAYRLIEYFDNKYKK